MVALDAYDFIGAPTSSDAARWTDLLNGVNASGSTSVTPAAINGQQFEGYGLNWLAAFGKAHDKEVGLPEWGLGSTDNNGGGGDDAYYVTQMASWIKANATGPVTLLELRRRHPAIGHTELHGRRYPGRDRSLQGRVRHRYLARSLSGPRPWPAARGPRLRARQGRGRLREAGGDGGGLGGADPDRAGELRAEVGRDHLDVHPWLGAWIIQPLPR